MHWAPFSNFWIHYSQIYLASNFYQTHDKQSSRQNLSSLTTRAKQKSETSLAGMIFFASQSAPWDNGVILAVLGLCPFHQSQTDLKQLKVQLLCVLHLGTFLSLNICPSLSPDTCLPLHHMLSLSLYCDNHVKNMYGNFICIFNWQDTLSKPTLFTFSPGSWSCPFSTVPSSICSASTSLSFLHWLFWETKNLNLVNLTVKDNFLISCWVSITSEHLFVYPLTLLLLFGGNWQTKKWKML